MPIPFARWMRRVRTDKGLTQMDLATAAEKLLAVDGEGKKAHLSNSFMSNIENGRRVPRPELAEALSVALGKPRALGLFMSGVIPPNWFRTDATDEGSELQAIEEIFADLNRLASGAAIVVRGGEMLEGGEPNVEKVEPSVHMTGEPDGSEKPTPV